MKTRKPNHLMTALVLVAAGLGLSIAAAPAQGGVLDGLPDIANLAVNGIPVAAAVLLTVQALKYAGLVTTDHSARRANVVTALVYGGVWLARSLAVAPELSVAFVIDTAFVALVGSLLAGLVYEGVSAVAARVSPPKA